MKTIANTNNEKLKLADDYLRQGKLRSAKSAFIDELKKEVSSYYQEKVEKLNDESISKRYLAHYTDAETIYSVLDNYKKNDPSCLRLYEASSMNDPDEGKHIHKKLKEILETNHEDSEEAIDYAEFFICSFVSDYDSRIGDKLRYWQSYGKDGLGCSIQIPLENGKGFTPISYGEEIDINNFEPYLQPYLEWKEKLLEQYRNEDQTNFTTEIYKALAQLMFSYKSRQYEHEKEFRYIKTPASGKEIEHHFKSEGPYLKGPYLRKYVLEDNLEAKKILTADSTIYIGPRVPNKESFRQKLEQLARSKGLVVTFRCSNVRYQKVW